MNSRLQNWRDYHRDDLRGPGDRFREAVAETLTDWRLGRASQRASFSGAEQVFAAGVGEIAALRLQLALLPILNSLQRIEDLLDRAFDPRPDPYVPPARVSPVRFEPPVPPPPLFLSR